MGLRGSALALLCAGLADAGILEKLVDPMGVDQFLANIHEQDWAYFPRNESVVPIAMGQVSEWIMNKGDGQEIVEILPNPITGKEYKPSKKKTALQRVQEAFLQGYSMVINSLHRWSEPGLRLSQDLFKDSNLPVDVYMYLTPPHSMSYGLHNDVMDAWMIQLHGSKRWQLCGRNKAPWKPEPSMTDNGTCTEVTMRGGDTMYVPFHFLHKATTTDELSMHLTVNIERQYYVWGAVIMSMVSKAMKPNLEVHDFVGSGELDMDGEAELTRLLWRLYNSEPRLMRLPLQSAQGLTKPLCRADLPSGYLEEITQEFGSVMANLLAGIKQMAGNQKVRVGSTVLTAERFADLLAKEKAASTLPWALEVARLHSLIHHGRDNPARFLVQPDVLSSLAALRSTPDTAKKANQGVKMNSLTLSADTLLVRHPDSRALLLLEDRKSDTAPAVLRVNGEKLEVPAQHLALCIHSLGLFGQETAAGKPFRAGDVPGGLPDAVTFLRRMITLGALEVLQPSKVGPTPS